MNNIVYQAAYAVSVKCKHLLRQVSFEMHLKCTKQSLVKICGFLFVYYSLFFV